MLRQRMERLVAMLAGIDGLRDIAMTGRNGALNRPARPGAADAGLAPRHGQPGSLANAVFMELKTMRLR